MMHELTTAERLERLRIHPSQGIKPLRSSLEASAGTSSRFDRKAISGERNAAGTLSPLSGERNAAG